jgi:uncharacterized DUF497 family protein
MDVEFDDVKDAANLSKHGVSLALGAVVLANPIGEVVDDRRDYGEHRINAFGLVKGRLFACTYTIRNDARGSSRYAAPVGRSNAYGYRESHAGAGRQSP